MKKILERKAFEFKLDSPPDEAGRFTGYAAIFNEVDLGNDVIEPGAFKKSLSENPEVPILWAHNADEPIGVSTRMVEDGKGLKVEAQLAMDVQRAREIHSLMRLGAIKGLSIGYQTVKRYFAGQVRHLQELRLGEFSPVVFPMQTLAQVGSVKDLYLAGDELQGVGCLLTAIEAGSTFLDNEAREGDAEDVAAMQSILADLVVLLASELSEVGQSDDGGEPVPINGTMRSSLELSIQSLKDVLDGKTAGRKRVPAVSVGDDDYEPFYELLNAMRGESR